MLNDLMVKTRMVGKLEVPSLGINATLKSALDLMTRLSLGVCVFLDSDDQVVGVLTDGDLRRLILNKQQPLPALLISPALSFGNSNPLTIQETASIKEASVLMDSRRIWDLPVVNSHNRFVGILNRHMIS